MPVTTGPVYQVGAPGVEQLNYSNPLNQQVSPIWYNQERYYVLLTPYQVVWTEPPQVPVKEYRFHYGTSQAPGGEVPGQFPVYSLIPGSYHYQPVSEIVYVYVPHSYTPNSLRS